MLATEVGVYEERFRPVNAILDRYVSLDIPTRIVVAVFAKLSMYEFRVQSGAIPELLRKLEKRYTTVLAGCKTGHEAWRCDPLGQVEETVSLVRCSGRDGSW